MSKKPSIFIGSSGEGHEIAKHLQLGLRPVATVNIWSQGVFGLGHGTLDELVRASRQFDFAVLVLTPDDLKIKRTNEINAARDNVLFELGLFMGTLGPQRTFMVYPESPQVDLPSDVAGVTAATFSFPDDGNWQAALGHVCTQIEIAMKRAADAADRGDPILRSVLKDALHVICRTASLPRLPEQARLRAFLFRRQPVDGRDCLVCYDFYDPLQASEVIGELRFEINSETSDRIVVVEALRARKVVGRKLAGTGQGTPGVHGNISTKLKAVVAAPIMQKRDVWGVVDFDAATENGARLLTSDQGYAAIHQVARLIGGLVSPMQGPTP